MAEGAPVDVGADGDIRKARIINLPIYFFRKTT